MVIINSGVAGRGDEGGPPRAAKLELYLKIWGVKRYFEAGEEIFEGGGETTQRMEVTRWSEKYQTSKKKAVKNLRDNRQKEPGGVANLGSAPGGRHPSYPTDYKYTILLIKKYFTRLT